jgi:hypothetical protein
MTERDIFLALLDLPDPAARSAFLENACAEDAGLCTRVKALLQAHENAGSFLDKPAVSPARLDENATQDLGDSSVREPREDADDKDLSFLDPSTRPDSLGRLDHYEILEVLGRGGFGIVFRAFDERLQRVVAVKVLAPKLAATFPPRKRFVREARSSAKVRHENVVQVYAVEEQPLPYLVMEFVPGETLQQRLDRTGPLEVTDVVQIGRQIAEGLSAAHGTGLIHRDIKPANILIEPGPRQHVKISDFGLARAADDVGLSQCGMVAGTPMFMSPEQANGEPLDHRADLFSLGSVLYTMCTGQPPFRAKSTLAVLRRVADDMPRPIPETIPEVPSWLCDIIARLHAKKPEDRFATAREVADMLERGVAVMQHPRNGKPPQVAAAAAMEKTLLSSEILDAAPTLRQPRLGTRRWATAAAVLLVLLGGLGFTEATGFTNVRGTVIRLFSPEGTLVVEVDDPKVSVKIVGSEVVITGAGAQEIRLKPGSYTVVASKDGRLVRQELVTVTNNGREVVRVSQETQPTGAQAGRAAGSANATHVTAKATDAAAWERSVSTLPTVERAKAVAIRLQELNPGFDGTITPTIEYGVVKGLEIIIDHVIDISPIRVLTGLTSLTCRGSDAFNGQFIDGARSTGYEEGRISIRSVGKSRLVDLSPVTGLPLTNLSCVNCNVYDLTPLKGMKLKFLHVGSTLIYDLSPLVGMPLENLDFSFTKVSDISPLKGMKLTSVGFEATEVSDLTPLKGMALRHLAIGRKVTDLTPLTGMPLEGLTCHQSRISDLSPLKGMPLKLLNCGGTLVSDLSPLKGMPLSHLGLDGTKVSDLAPLRGMRLKDLGVPNTQVSDLSPLKGMPLEKLQCQGSKVTDLSPVKDLPLTWFVCDFRPERDAKILRAISTLKTINLKPAAQFWKEVEEKTKAR